MNLHESIKFLRSLGWPPNSFVIFGSAPLAVRGIRPANDLDVVLHARLWDELKNGIKVSEHVPGVSHGQIGPIEVLNAWWPYVGEPEEIIADAEVIDGLPYASLERVLRWKRQSTRPKDLTDVQLIEQYLARSDG